MKVNKFAILCLVIYAAVTIYFNYTHVMWFDEAHSWLIAKQLGFVDMLKYIKNEGHFFVWQVLLYPFAILQRLCDTNMTQVYGYGHDEFCESAKAKIRAACGIEDAEIQFITGGTQTNQIVIDTMLAQK